MKRKNLKYFIIILLILITACIKDTIIKPINHKEVIVRNLVSTNISLVNRNNYTIAGYNIVAGSRAAITLTNCNNIVIENCRLSGGTTINSVGIYLVNCANITIYNNFITNVASGVYIVNCTGGINVEYNQFLNMLGPFPRGQFVQFNTCTGSNNIVIGNKCENILGQSNPEDNISIYQSNGTSSSPITISNNSIRGGGPSTSGGGIMLGDNGGSYQTAENNILVNPGQYGISVSSGTNMQILNNKIFASKNPWTNIGLAVWNQYSTQCSIITVSGNQINYTNSSGINNGAWNGGNCGIISGWSSNNFDNPSITALILPQILITDK